MDLSKIKSDKTICGIIGNPLGHTLSPAMHNAAFFELKLDFEYLIFEITDSEIKTTFDSLKAKNFRGLNVTHPFKIKVMDYLDELDSLAKEIGAVNVIVNDNGKIIGYNTDSFGAVSALRSNGVDVDFGRKKVLILGAGGAARAVAVPLVKMGNELIIANRTYQRGKELATMLGKFGVSKAVKIQNIHEEIEDVEILINATSVGMKGGPGGSPIPGHLLRDGLTVFDLVYTPKNTQLLTDSKESGARIIYGYEMFIYQGVKSFELWTNESAPVDVMRKVVIDELD